MSLVFVRLVTDGYAAGEIETDTVTPIPRAVHADFTALRAFGAADVPDPVRSRGPLVWTQLFGTLSFELHGHLHNVINDHDAFFGLRMRRAAHVLLAGG